MNRSSFKQLCAQLIFLIFLTAITLSVRAQQAEFQNSWGTFVAPVYNTSESGAYAGAELFTGPKKLGSYFAGVLPNGTKSTPAGTVAQIGMNPLGAALTPDSKYLITSNDDERENGFQSFQSTINLGGYTLSVVDTSTLSVVSQINSVGKFFVGMQATGAGPYTVWVSGGADQDVKLFTVAANGVISANGHIVIAPITPPTDGYVSSYVPDPYFNTVQGNGFKPSVPTNFDRVNGAQITFPAGSALSPDGKFVYVACNGDNSVAVIDTSKQAVVQHVAVGYFRYAVVVSQDGSTVLVSNWGVTEYKFNNPGYSNCGQLNSRPPIPNNEVSGYFVPVTNTTGNNPKTSSVSILSAPGGDGSKLSLIGSVYQGHALDAHLVVGDTHPSAMAIVRGGGKEYVYITKSNSDAIAVMDTQGNNITTLQTPLIPSPNAAARTLHGTYPNAIVVSPDSTRAYVAEAGIGSIAALDTTNPAAPKLIGRIPTNWYPTGVVLSADGNTLYVLNAKGIGEDINPNTDPSKSPPPPPAGIISTPTTDSNYIFGSLQQINLSGYKLDLTTVPNNDYKVLSNPPDTSVVPVGGGPSKKIQHVVFILQENKTFDSKLGNLGGHFGVFSSLWYNNTDGSPYYNGQYTGVALNYQLLAQKFAAAVNYYSDSEESDAGHQVAASGTATDYSEKTLLVKGGRGLLVNKNFEPEDYPETGYIFNNAARNGVSFKEYGVFAARIDGSDTGTNGPTTLNDPLSGNCGAPELNPDNFHLSNPLVNLGDVTTQVQGLGQSFFMTLAGLAVMGENNANGEPHLDHNYPGYNFNISDQRRAQEFIADFDRMLAKGTLPQFIYLYIPNEHTGSVQCPNANQVFGSASNVQQVADGDVALGIAVQHLMQSSAYYDPNSDTGMAIFVSPDDGQSTLDHIHPHRSPMFLVSPFAKPSYYSTRHYVTASIVKTEELLVGLPPEQPWRYAGDRSPRSLPAKVQSHHGGQVEV
jgi:YVTN family beta-propeller protein